MADVHGKQTDDPFARAKEREPEPLPERYVSSTTVSEGEGLRVFITRAELVVSRFDSDKKRPEPRYVLEIEGTVLESRAERFREGTTVVITCGSVRLEQLANEGPQVDDVLTLVHGGTVGTRVEWRWVLERDGEQEPVRPVSPQAAPEGEPWLEEPPEEEEP